MVKPINKIYTLGAADANWFADNATGATITLAENDTPDGQAYKVAVLNNSLNDLSGITMTLVGLDADGRSQTDSFVLPIASQTVYSNYYFSRLTSATISATLGVNTIDIGTSTQFCSPTIVTDYSSIGAEFSVDFASTVTINYSVQCTSDAIQTKTPPFYWQSIGTALASQTAPQNAVNLQSPRAVRIVTASYTATPTIQFSVLQAGNRG